MSLLLADQSGDLAEAFEMRQLAVSDYFLTVFVYNFSPFVAVASLAWVQEDNRKSVKVFLAALLCLLVFGSLLLTFQKRPVLIFSFAMLMCWKLYRVFCVRNVDLGRTFRIFLSNSKKYLFSLFVLLAGLYFFYTDYRFTETDVGEMLVSLMSVVCSRIFGRLSIPAALYIDFFPDFHDYYGFENVGLFSMLAGSQLFQDTKVVFSQYSYYSLDGTVAASVFVDAYGQAGCFWVPLVGILVGVLIFAMKVVIDRAAPGSSRLLFFIFGAIFVYYLSQASLFRSLLGYGGGIWFLLWKILMKKGKVSEGK